MSVYESSITNPKKQLEFYKQLSEQLQVENKQLKKQLEEYQLQNINLRADIMIQKMALPHKEIKDKTFFNLYDMPTYEDLLNQQKEFIDLLEDKIKFSTKPTTCVLLKSILQNYKEIIGVLNDSTK